MASSLLLRTSRRFFLSPSIPKGIHPRFVSSTGNKKLEINTVVTPEDQQQPPKISYYNQAAGNSQPHIKPDAQYSKGGQRSFKPQSDSAKHPLDIEAATSGDPLRHILNHPSASIILRDACRCNRCKDRSTSQRDFHLAQIPLDIKPSRVEQDAQGNLVVQWHNDIPGWEDHISIFSPQQIARLRTWMNNEHRTSTRLWDKEEFTRDNFEVTYDEYMNSDAALAKTIYYFARHGVVFIEKVPEDPHAVERLAGRIAHMKSTFYGPTWDIKSMPNATNVAFTNKYLGFHGDLMYMKEPPTVQFLHCIHNSCEGGESRFVDQFKAIDTLYSEDREMADALTSTKLRYELDNDGFFYSDVKPIIQWRTDSYAFPRRVIRGAVNDQVGHIYRTFWGPQFLGSIIADFGTSDTKLKKSIKAMKKYAEILERDELVYQEKMIPGRCVMFDNLRVLHARNEFDPNTGKRWLRGTYVDGQDLWNLEMKFKDQMAQFELETTNALKRGPKSKKLN